MKTLLKWGGFAFGGFLVLVAVGAAAVYGMTERRVNKVYDVQPAPVLVPDGDPATIARGAHIAAIRGCADCHGENLGGNVFADDPALGRLIASNLTAGRNGAAATFDERDWVRAIRHGIGPDGKPLLFMPSHEFNVLSDSDVAALIAYFRSLPAVDYDPQTNRLGPLGRLLFVAGQLPLVPAELIDHDAPRSQAPVPGPTVEYGAYLASGCVGCHGEGYSGGKIPGTPPNWLPAANITPDPGTGIGAWSEQDFFRALREGKRPDGSAINPDFMPWRTTAAMTDDELRAIRAFLMSLPPRPDGTR